MAGLFTPAGREIAAKAIAAVSTHIAIYNGDPTGSGTVSSSSRAAVAFPTSAPDGDVTAPQVGVPMTTGGVASHYALFTAATGGTMTMAGSLDGVAETYANAGGVCNVTPSIDID